MESFFRRITLKLNVACEFSLEYPVLWKLHLTTPCAYIVEIRRGNLNFLAVFLTCYTIFIDRCFFQIHGVGIHKLPYTNP